MNIFTVVLQDGVHEARALDLPRPMHEYCLTGRGPTRNAALQDLLRELWTIMSELSHGAAEILEAPGLFPERGEGPPNLRRLDTYPGHLVPNADFETCLKVLRTVRNVCLGPHHFDADGAVVLSHAHAKLVELCKLCEDESPEPLVKEDADAGAATPDRRGAGADAGE